MSDECRMMEPNCRGCPVLGTACGMCPRCRETAPPQKESKGGWLVLEIRYGEEIRIGEDIRITAAKGQGADKVRLLFKAPREQKIVRQVLIDRRKAREAAGE